MKRITDGIESFLELGGIKREVILLVISAAALAVSLIMPGALPIDPAWAAVILCGVPIVLEAFVGLVTEFDVTADVLVSLALIASVCIREYFAAGEVAVIMQFGALLEDLTVSKARAGAERLIRMTPETARVVRGGEEHILPAGEVRVGDIVRVLPGERIPVDGVIVSGDTSVDQSVMTGEPIPVDVTAGDEVTSGTLNMYGAFDMCASRVGEDSSIQRMARLVQSADTGKVKIVRLADKWAVWIVVTALTAAAVIWAATGEVIRAVTVLVVFCPCSLVLATPTAVTAAIGNAARRGALVREGDALERLASVRTVAFDKTGTLTRGRPAVVHVGAAAGGIGPEELFALAASAELRSEHPLGKAVTSGYRERTDASIAEPERFEMLPGMGVNAVVSGRSVSVGNDRLMSRCGAHIPTDMRSEVICHLARGCTVVYAAVDGMVSGYIALSDTVREESAAAAEDLKAQGKRVVMLTGDGEGAAARTAEALCIDEWRSGCLPEDKLEFLAGCSDSGESVCMVGDGINDAPALKRADVGVAMGGVGSDIAVNAADIVLTKESIGVMPHLTALSGHMMTVIKRNLAFSMALNVAAIILAMSGVLGPVTGALVHNAGSVFVIVCSALLLRWESRRRRRAGV